MDNRRTASTAFNNSQVLGADYTMCWMHQLAVLPDSGFASRIILANLHFCNNQPLAKINYSRPKLSLAIILANINYISPGLSQVQTTLAIMPIIRVVIIVFFSGKTRPHFIKEVFLESSVLRSGFLGRECKACSTLSRCLLGASTCLSKQRYQHEA